MAMGLSTYTGRTGIRLVFHPVQDFLDAADREGRNDELAAAAHCVIDDCREAFAVVIRLMQTISVRRLDQQVVRLGYRCGIRQHRPAVPAEVSTEEDRFAGDVHARKCRAEQMPGVDEVDLDSVGHGHLALVADRLQAIERACGVIARVQRKRRMVARIPMPIRVARVFFLQMGRIGQHERAEILGRRRAEDPAAKS
jgi:hypothetical protein